jgi:hypothetical protein
LAELRQKGKITAVVGIGLVVTVPTMFAMLSVNFLLLTETPHWSGNEKSVLLKPSKWIGKKFPLLQFYYKRNFPTLKIIHCNLIGVIIPMKKTFILIVFILYLFLATFNDSFAIDDAMKEKITHAFRGMDDSRMRLNSGICHISGTTIINEEVDTESITIAFDYKKGMYRFDRPDCYSLRMPEYYYEVWFPNKENSGVTRQKSSERTPSWKAKPFDIQMLGYFTLVGPYHQRTYQPDERLVFFEEIPISYEQLSEDLILLETRRKPLNPLVPLLKRRYWLSPKQGYSLLKAEYMDLVTIEMSWTEKNKTWVPTAFKLSSKQNHSADWKIDWEQVNEPVPDKYFIPEQLVEKPTPVFSSELGESIQIGTFGRKDVTPIKIMKMDQPKIKYPYTRHILIITGLVLIFISLCKMFYDRYKRH